MKIRFGFISNSSSASFAIPLDKISTKQLEQIINHSKEGAKLGLECADDEWDCVDDEWYIEVTDTEVRGYTIMDNFPIEDFFELIGIPEDVVDFDGSNYPCVTDRLRDFLDR